MVVLVLVFLIAWILLAICCCCPGCYLHRIRSVTDPGPERCPWNAQLTAPDVQLAVPNVQLTAPGAALKELTKSLNYRRSGIRKWMAPPPPCAHCRTPPATTTATPRSRATAASARKPGAPHRPTPPLETGGVVRSRVKPPPPRNAPRRARPRTGTPEGSTSS